MTIKQLLLFWVLLSACGMVKRGAIPWEESKKKPPQAVQTKVPISAVSVVKTDNFTRDEKKMRSTLDEAFKDWKGVPYLLGGNGFDGVDCSAFLQNVLGDYFNVELPRVTDDQIKVGKSVNKNNIKIGDLVFFKTGRNTLHAGIMINSQQFMHASTSSGVMISALQERYWSDAYLTTRRVF